MLWQEQYARVLRSLARIQVQNRPRQEYEDDLLHFFMDCWHLKDWIANDGTLSEAVHKAILDSVHSSHILLVCRDLANRSKHLVLRGRTMDGRLAADFPSDAGEPLQADGSAARIRQIHFMVLEDELAYDALYFAQEAVREWKALLSEHGLKVP
jgi:hypothetical protein